MANHRFNLIDSVIVLLASCSLLLFIFFLVGRTPGNDPIIETLPEWLLSGSSAIWSMVSSGLLSTIVWIIRRQATDGQHPNYLVGIMITTVLIGLLVMTLSYVFRINESPSNNSSTISASDLFELAYDRWSYAKKEFDSVDVVVQYLSKAIRLERSASIYALRGVAFWQKKQFDRALRDFNDAITLDPNKGEFYNWRGIIYWHLNDEERAYKEWHYAGDAFDNDIASYNWFSREIGSPVTEFDPYLWGYY